MPKVSFAFFATGALAVLVGMTMGMWMGATQQFTLSPVHAHINLIGWASMGLMGTFYALAGDRAPHRLAWVNYGLVTVGLVIMAPSLGKMLLGDPSFEKVVIASSMIVFAGALTFFVAIVMTWRNSSRAARPASGVAATMPAE